MRYEIYKQLTIWGKRWAWRLKARNGKIIASGESYNNYDDCINAIELVQSSDHALISVKKG